MWIGEKVIFDLLVTKWRHQWPDHWNDNLEKAAKMYKKAKIGTVDQREL